MEEEHINVLDARKPNGRSRLGRVRVARCGNDGCNGVAARAAVEPSRKWFSASDTSDQLEQRGSKLHDGKDGLCLRVAKAAVEFDDLRSVAREHESRIQEPREGRSPLTERIDRWGHDAMHGV